MIFEWKERVGGTIRLMLRIRVGYERKAVSLDCWFRSGKMD